MKALILYLAAAVLATSSACAQSAEQIMERTRLGATLQSADLEGNIRTGRKKVPVYLFLRGENIQFRYSPDNKNWKGFHMQLEEDQDLFEVVDGKLMKFPSDMLKIQIAGSDLTFEDLSLRFLYWPNPKLLGEERVGTQNCYKIRIDNPGRTGAYRTMYVWVHKEFGAFMKVEGFDRSGNLLKRFTVEGTMKLPDGSYTLKDMQVSTFRGGRAVSNSYLEFDKPKKAGPGGLR